MTDSEPVLSYSRTLNVQVPSKDMLEEISNEIMTTEDGYGNLHITWEDFSLDIPAIAAWIGEHKNIENYDLEAHKFLLKVHRKAEGEIGDVVFCCDE